MPSYAHIEQNRAHMQELKDYGGSGNDLNIHPAFQNRLDAYCREHQKKLALLPELTTDHRVSLSRLER